MFGRLIRALVRVLLAIMVWPSHTMGQEGIWKEVEMDGVRWAYQELGPGSGACRIKLSKKTGGRIAIPRMVERVGENDLRVVAVASWAFNLCEALTQIEIPEGVTTIESQAFRTCTLLKVMTIPRSVTTIESDAFIGCSSMEHIDVASGNARYSSIDGVLFSKDGKKLVRFPEGRSGRYAIPHGVEAIESYAFFGCRDLEAVDIPEGVSEIKAQTFCGVGLTSIAIPVGVVAIGDCAFQLCSELESIELPVGLKSIGNEAFADCCELKSISIPGSVRFIGENAFWKCVSLKAVSIPEGITSVSRGLFGYCSGLTNVALPAGVRSIGKYAFQGCSGLQECALPSSVETIEEGSFARCVGLQRITIPEEVSYVGKIAFSASGLQAVYWLSSSDFEVEGTAFQGIVGTSTLYVRLGSASRVRESVTGWWRPFGRIAEGHTVKFDAGGGTPVPGPRIVEVGKRVDRPTEAPSKMGYEFLGWYQGEDEESPYDFDRIVADNMTLVARWRRKPSGAESELLVGARVVENPVGGLLALEGMAMGESVEVYSVHGVKVFSSSLHGDSRVEINTIAWPIGVYVARVLARDGAKMLRVVKD